MQILEIKRRTLVDEACDRLRQAILDKGLTPNDRLSEPELARTMGISRTPLRAALARLHEEGLVELRPGRRVRVCSANAEMVRGIYPVIAALDGFALQAAALADAIDLTRLRTLNQGIQSSVPPKRLFELDRLFHEGLRAGCPNRRILDLLQRHLVLASRFDGAEARGLHAIKRTRVEHATIIEALQHDQVAQARQLLESHWLGGIEIVLDWLTRTDTVALETTEDG
jgi:DNA-binding GntR family transcriptional regulator